MALRPNATLTFAVHPEWGAAYRVEEDGIRMHFVCADPGAGEPSDYFAFLTDAELAGVVTNPQLKTLVTTKLQRAIRATGIAAKLDAFVGQSLTL